MDLQPHTMNDKTNATEDKRFGYLLEMHCPPGGINEHLFALSSDINVIEQTLKAHLKGEQGFYRALIYGQQVYLHLVTDGNVTHTINLLPYLRMIIPGFLEATFTEAGKPDIRNPSGEPMPESWIKKIKRTHKRTKIVYEEEKREYLRNYLWNYIGFQNDETVFLGDYRAALPPANLLLEQEAVIRVVFENTEFSIKCGYVFEQENDIEGSITDFIAFRQEQS